MEAERLSFRTGNLSDRLEKQNPKPADDSKDSRDLSQHAVAHEGG
jgi:hypothetical protein